jgi:uncharacterized protein (DUF1697 family)
MATTTKRVAKAPAKNRATKKPATKPATKPAKKPAKKKPAKKPAKKKPAKKPAAKKPAAAKKPSAKPLAKTTATPAVPARPGKGTRYALLLRGINVGTKNSLPMAELRAMLVNLGCTAVATYVQSGNAVLTTTLSTAKLTTAIEEALARYMGRPISTTLRTREQLAAIVAGHPFPELVAEPANHTYLCVTFFSQAPTAAQTSPLKATDFAPERLRLAGSELYTWHPDGQARSPLAVAIGKLKIPGAVTTRNWRTVTTLLAMLEQI